MNFELKYNTKVPAVKRLMLEALELKEATEEYSAYPLEDNLFEWHFTVKGATGTEFENGLYHGRIVFPNEYPMKPPNIILLTPNGRFEINKKICLSISGHHPETWIPSWSIRTALLALIAFMPTPGKGTLGSLDYTPEERKVLARKSKEWKCSQCGILSSLLGKKNIPATSSETNLINCLVFKGEENKITKETVGVEAITETKTGGTSPMETECIPPMDPECDMSPLGDAQISGFWISDRTSNFLIAVIVVILSFLIYRRLFIL